jgi:hypothetical protein
LHSFLSKHTGQRKVYPPVCRRAFRDDNEAKLSSNAPIPMYFAVKLSESKKKVEGFEAVLKMHKYFYLSEE